jgi:mono/diheme cytochrome c family protein
MLLITHTRRAATMIAATLIGGVLVSVAAVTPSSGADAQYIGWTRTTIVAPVGSPRGYLEFQNSCSVCHGPMPERPGTRALGAKDKGAEPALLEQRKDLSPELIRLAVRKGITVMPPFRKTEVTDADLDAIIAYLTRDQR